MILYIYIINIPKCACIPLQNAQLYVIFTTDPCHECAKNMEKRRELDYIYSSNFRRSGCFDIYMCVSVPNILDGPPAPSINGLHSYA